MKTFYDGIYIEKEKLEEAGIQHHIKIEYYKTILEKENVEKLYGIEIVETEFKNGQIEIETKELKEITNSEEEINKILEIFKDNEVTPIGAEDVLEEILLDE